MSKIDEFIQVVDDIYGLYLDCINAIEDFRTNFIQNQKVVSIKLEKTLGKLDSSRYIFGKGEPSKGKRLHSCTQGELKKRTEKNGKDNILIARLCIAMIYSYWEDYFRQAIAIEMGKEKNELVSDIIGDLKYFRESIIHHRSIAIKKIEKTKKLKWFKEGQEININENQFEEIIDKIKEEINELKEIKK